jgi:hypothetical protein
VAWFLVERSVFGKRSKERERYYLLPGQGGKSYRRKQMFILKWTAAAALVFGLLAAGLIWWFSNPLH